MSGSDGKSVRFVFVNSDDECTEDDECTDDYECTDDDECTESDMSFKIVSRLSDRSLDAEVSSLNSMDSENVDRDAAGDGATAFKLTLREAAESTDSAFTFGSNASATMNLREVSTKGSCPLQMGMH